MFHFNPLYSTWKTLTIQHGFYDFNSFLRDVLFIYLFIFNFFTFWHHRCSRLVGRHLREFPAPRPWTSVHSPALSIPSMALLLFDQDNLFTLSFYVYVHRHTHFISKWFFLLYLTFTWFDLFVSFLIKLQFCCCDCFRPDTGSGRSQWKCCCCGCRGHERIAARLSLLRPGDPHRTAHSGSDASGPRCCFPST